MSTDTIEETETFRPAFGPDGLVTGIAVDHRTGEILMVAHLNEQALDLTLATGVVHYWSRSRRSIWRKGDTSGQSQKLVEMRVDCDQDALELRVEVGGDGGACHTGRRSCFYRSVHLVDGVPRLAPSEA